MSSFARKVGGVTAVVVVAQLRTCRSGRARRARILAGTRPTGLRRCVFAGPVPPLRR
jgi:hypothetical protein